MSPRNDVSESHRSRGGAKRWFLLTGNRVAVAAAMLAGVGGLFVAAGLLGVATVTTPNRVMWYLNGTVNGLLTLVPIAVGVNQIVLSHEFGSVQDLYDRRKEVDEFRKQVERRTGAEVSSPRASEFFATLLDSVAETAESFRDAYEQEGGRTDEIESYVESVVAGSQRTSDELTAEEYTMLATLLTVLAYDDSLQFHETRRVENALDEDVSNQTRAKLYEIEALFTDFDAARQYLKTVVVEQQLARLSRLLVYTGIPSVAVAALRIFTYRDVAGLTLSHAALVAVAGSLVAVSLVPLAVLSAYILRVATIARRTATFGPFVPASKLPSDDGSE